MIPYFLAVLVACMLMCLLGLRRNSQVYKFRTRILREDSAAWKGRRPFFPRYDSLPSYNSMFWKFWIPVNSFERRLSRLGEEEAVGLVNCLTCGTGKTWWFPRPDGYKCPTCQGDPLKGNGREDWKDYSRAQMIRQFGPRLPGDKELVMRYFPEEKGD